MKIITGPWAEIAGMVHWKALIDRAKKHRPLFEQHYTTSTKLYIADRHLIRISKIIPNHKATDLGLVIISKVEYHWEPIFLQKGADYLSELDGFFYSLRSCIDSFLWEINYIFKLGCSRAAGILGAMKSKYPEEKITKLLNTLSEKDWFIYLNYIRNNLAHYTLLEIETYTEDPSIYLPRHMKPTYYSEEKGFEVIPHLKYLLENTRQFLEKGYSLLIEEHDES